MTPEEQQVINALDSLRTSLENELAIFQSTGQSNVYKTFTLEQNYFDAIGQVDFVMSDVVRIVADRLDG